MGVEKWVYQTSVARSSSQLEVYEAWITALMSDCGWISTQIFSVLNIDWIMKHILVLKMWVSTSSWPWPCLHFSKLIVKGAKYQIQSRSVIEGMPPHGSEHAGGSHLTVLKNANNANNGNSADRANSVNLRESQLCMLTTPWVGTALSAVTTVWEQCRTVAIS